ncbi:MAG: Nif3-like dinuclear metal center hexameric protein [Rikenellaceae bacterium]|jgi:dinuclear metal center YbgI/SA1388 family protein|nr:Nif3-like dinuclear metal center hexameric protein [Rikenellaceae bacterium]
MKIREITDAVEAFAPLALQASFDNSGLIAGRPEREVDAALLCVDVTEATVDEAISLGAGIIVAHHPVVFNPLKRITGASYVERVVERAIRHDIALYAAHTNLDAAPCGLSHWLAALFGVREEAILEPQQGSETVGFGIVGHLPAPRNTVDFLREVKDKLGLKALRHSAINHDAVQRVALSSGSGASMIALAKASGAELYLAADFKYNNFLEADRELTIADIGHFESESCATEILYEVIRKKFPTFAVHKSKNSINPVNYLI